MHSKWGVVVRVQVGDLIGRIIDGVMSVRRCACTSASVVVTA